MISIELTQRFTRIVRENGRESEVLKTLRLVAAGFGRPHAHAGLSIRKLSKNLCECRTNLHWRLIFEARPGCLTFDFAGDHTKVRNYLRGKR